MLFFALTNPLTSKFHTKRMRDFTMSCSLRFHNVKIVNKVTCSGSKSLKLLRQNIMLLNRSIYKCIYVLKERNYSNHSQMHYPIRVTFSNALWWSFLEGLNKCKRIDVYRKMSRSQVYNHFAPILPIVITISSTMINRNHLLFRILVYHQGSR